MTVSNATFLSLNVAWQQAVFGVRVCLQTRSTSARGGVVPVVMWSLLLRLAS